MAYEGLAGKNVLITGGSSGIGQAIAIRMGATEGCNVAINYRSSQEEAQETIDKIQAGISECRRQVEGAGKRFIPVQADVSKAEDVERMMQASIEALGGLDVVVNNAGIQIAGDSHKISLSQFQKVLEVNLIGAFHVSQLAIQHFLADNKPGVIINVSSVHQQIPKPRFVGYSASKGGMDNMTRTLALEYANRNIRVNGIGPGATVTPINSAWVDDPEKRAEVEKHIPMGRAGTSEEMAAVTAWLCSDAAAYITGQTLFVDGGLTLYPDFRTAWSSE